MYEQTRKFISQMSTAETTHVLAAVAAVVQRGIKFDNEHIRQQLVERGLTPDEIVAAIPTAAVVEVSQKGSDYRVLLRNYRVRPRHIVVCLSLRSGQVVTCWRQDPNDHHKSATTQYKWQVDLATLALC